MRRIMTDRIELEHYVPQFYLRNFSIKNNGKRLYCFDKHTFNKFVTNIQNIACGKYFYDIPENDQYVEKSLAKIESILSAVYNKLITNKDI